MLLESSVFAGLGEWIGGHPEVTITATGLVGTAASWLVDHQRRRRWISYRVHMDAPVYASPNIRGTGDLVVRKKDSSKDVKHPSLVLIRVSNSGRLDIEKDDFNAPIKFTFGDRQVEGFELFELSPPGLGDILQPESTDHPGEGLVFSGNQITLPVFPFNRGERFKLLVLLSGKGKGVKGSGHLKGGRLIRDISGPGPSRRALAFGGVTLLLMGALVGLLLLPRASNGDTTAQCAEGTITLTGSSAFQPAVSEIAGVYEKLCPGATVRVTGGGSVAGINDLANQADETKRSAEAVMYDGTVPPGTYPTLAGTPIAAISFAVVVNQKLGVHNLTVDQLRGIFGGSYTYWDQVNPRLPHLRIDIVARDSQSGTRKTFENTVLGGQAQQPRNSQNCTDPDSGQASSVILCEMNGTAPLLQKISTTDGAIGYAELPESNTYPNVARIQINGHDPDIRQGGQRAYPFWTTEHIYTYRPPAPGSLLSAFLSYLGSDKAQNIMQSYGDIPCAGLNPDRQQELCQGRP